MSDTPPTLPPAPAVPPAPPAGEPGQQGVNLETYQTAIVAELQRDQAYVAHLQKELRAAKERVAGSRGKLDLLHQISVDAGSQAAPSAPPSPTPRGRTDRRTQR
ncbi:MAG TPA: hypothetical protein VFS21_29850 [Roseiflexaceae bacterium]|nr:hypothetical protein [Roseiflexaceae bacterium]